MSDPRGDYKLKLRHSDADRDVWEAIADIEPAARSYDDTLAWWSAFTVPADREAPVPLTELPARELVRGSFSAIANLGAWVAMLPGDLERPEARQWLKVAAGEIAEQAQAVIHALETLNEAGASG